ncbi:MAG: phosphoglucosamine mutase [Flavobacteriales bacterium]|nr:phosphoglucosamine mutase [Flavobacteriales bacterium]
MTLIKSISGIRGTIGGKAGENLTPWDTVKFTAGYAEWLKKKFPSQSITVVVGRDARISGPMISQLVIQTLIGCGIHVVDLGLSTTPTVEVAIPDFHAQGGVILTASHNPKQWNALKLLNEKGEFISAEDGNKLLQIADRGETLFAGIDELGSYRFIANGYIDEHIEKILGLTLVDVDMIREAELSIVVDAVNSTGGIAVPKLLEKLGVKEIHQLFCDPNGHFPHNPEPLPEHLTEISFFIKKNKCDLGIVVDPDVDRLALVCEDGSMFGEEYTLVAVADFVLRYKKGNTVSNLSSTRALRDITEKIGGNYYAAAVGEVNVVKKMKEVNAVIGGEGNGGVIYPELHYGRDALVGIALFLSHLAETKMKASELKQTYPAYIISKNKIELTPDINVDLVLDKIAKKYAGKPVNTEDGVKIELGNEWVHLRKSNTEPIIRIYAESTDENKAHALAEKMIEEIRSFC